MKKPPAPTAPQVRNFRGLRLTRTVWLIGFMSLLNDAASEMIYPLLPLYLATHLMAGPAVLGLIEGIADSVSAFLKLLSGMLVDRTRRSQPLIVLGYGFAAFSRPLLGLVSSWPPVLAIRVTDRIGKGLRTAPRDRMISRSVPKEHRGLAFGLHRGMDNAGAVIGPLAASVLLWQGWELPMVFAAAVVPGALCVCLSLFLEEPAPPPTPHSQEQKSAQAPSGLTLGFHGLSPRFWRFMCVSGLFILGDASHLFLLLRARELGVPQEHIPLLWALVAVVPMLGAAPFAAISDHRGRRVMLSIGWLMYAGFCLGMGFLESAPRGVWGLFLGYGLFLAMIEGAERAYVADLSPEELRGTAYGWFNLVTGVFVFPASLTFGLLWEHFGTRASFSYSAICVTCGAVLLQTWVPRASLLPSSTPQQNWEDGDRR